MTSDAASPSAMRTAWLVVALLWPVALLNYLDRQMLASMKTSVAGTVSGFQPEILNEQWGYMLGQFKWVYAFLSPVGGYVADRFSRRFAICGSLFVWSAVTWWTGHVQTYSELLWARSLMGMSEAFYIPAALALISDYHTGPTRSRAVGLHQMAIYCGVITGGFSGYVADNPDLTWRFAFYACGLFGMVYAVPLLLTIRDVPRVTADSESKPSSLRTVGELFGNLSFFFLVLYFTLPALAAWIVRDWMPDLLKQEFKISQGFAGVSATIYWQSAAIVSAVLGGWLADQWMRTNSRGRIYVSAIGTSLIVPALIGVGIAVSAKSLGPAVAALVLFGFGWGLFDGNNMPILCQIVRPEQRATGYGIMNFVSISAGGLADWSFGDMRDRQIPLNVIFGIFATIAISSVALVLMIRPKDSQHTDAP